MGLAGEQEDQALGYGGVGKDSIAQRGIGEFAEHSGLDGGE